MVLRRIPAFGTALAALVTTATLAQAERPSLDEQLNALLEVLSGEYEGKAPLGMTPGDETRSLVYRIRPVSAPQLGERLMYYTVTADAEERPILQAKIFVFSSEPKRTANTMHALVLTGAQAMTLRKDGEAGWQGLMRKDLMSFPPECFFTWSRADAGFAAEGSPTCTYESKAFQQVITPQMRYRITSEEFQLEETLLGEDGAAIVSTGGWLTATRR